MPDIKRAENRRHVRGFVFPPLAAICVAVFFSFMRLLANYINSKIKEKNSVILKKYDKKFIIAEFFSAIIT
jgi:hypothetical protein